MPLWPFQASQASQDAERLLAAVIEASRRPALFAAGRIPDTFEGRYESMVLYAALAMLRLKADAGAGPLAQEFADRLFRAFDAGLREAGVGDLLVPKRMRAMAGSFYGRLEAYAAAIASCDRAALTNAVARNVFANEAHAYAPILAEYVLETVRAQASAPLEGLLAQSGWPQPQ